MQGKRVYPNDEGFLILEAGEYGKDPTDGEWYMRPPPKEGFFSGKGRLSAHTVIEHEDGTITVSPSILVYGHHGRQWHGYLERGVWREV